MTQGEATSPRALKAGAACPRCGATLEAIGLGADPTVLSERGVLCPSCGFGIVSTYIPPMVADETKYTVSLCQDPTPKHDVLRLLMSRLHLGVLDARTRITQSDVAILEGSAVDAFHLRAELDESGLDYRIEPDFPYPDN